MLDHGTTMSSVTGDTRYSALGDFRAVILCRNKPSPHTLKIRKGGTGLTLDVWSSYVERQLFLEESDASLGKFDIDV